MFYGFTIIIIIIIIGVAHEKKCIAKCEIQK